MTSAHAATRNDTAAQGSALILTIGVAAVAVLIVVSGGWTGTDGPHLGLDALIILLQNLPWVLAWMCCAFGFGLPLRHWLAHDAEAKAAIQLVLGMAALLLLTAALGRLGLLQLGGSLGAWAVLLAGLGLSIEHVRRAPPDRAAQSGARESKPRKCRTLALVLLLTAAPAVAVLLLATTSAPGWLWRTEFGGYDVMSYHLQLPKEWLSLGAITPLEHNVYSFLPSYLEGAFYHLMVLRGDAIGAVYAAQLLHAAFAIAAAWLVAEFIRHESAKDRHVPGYLPAAVASVVLLGTPWVIVTGSLAYNELAAAVMLAGGLLTLRETSISPASCGAIIGVLSAAACGAKLAAVGFVAVPLVVLLLISIPWRSWHKALSAGAVAGFTTLVPYLWGNAAAAGNPVFPFATGIFGNGHWSAEQVDIWNEGHRAVGSLADRLGEAWRQLFQFGIGPNPYEAEPWIAQWSILPWLALFAMAVLVCAGRHRTLAIGLLLTITVQLVFWIGFTHIKSRFMTPMVVPGAIAIGLTVHWLLLRMDRPTDGAPSRATPRMMAAAAVLAAALMAWSSVPVFIFSREADGAPAARIGHADLISGDALSPADREAIGRMSLPSVYINDLLPPDAHVLFIGEAAPLYYQPGRYDYQTTWDRGPMSSIMKEFPDDPAEWTRGLRKRGYSHVLVNPVMLRIWQQSGWNDPMMTVDRIVPYAETHLELEHTWPSEERLYRIP